MSDFTLWHIRPPPEQRMYASAFRELVSKTLPDEPELFHHSPDGRTAAGLPPVRFLAGRKWLGIAFAPGYEPLLEKHMGAILSALSAHFHRPVASDVQTLATDAVFTHLPHEYWVSEMVLKRRGKAARNSDVGELIEQRLLSGLCRFAGHYGISFPSDPEKAREALSLEILDVVRPRGLRLITDNGPTDEYVTLADVRFRIAGELRGLWAAGNLTARGYGAIWKCLINDAQIAYAAGVSAQRKVAQ